MTKRELQAIEKLKENDTELCEQLIQEGIYLNEFSEVAWENKIFYPISLYENTSDDIRNQMITILEEDNEEAMIYANNILKALATIGGEIVADYFSKWEKQNKNWKNKLYVSPLMYAAEGFWCIEDNTYTKLFFDQAYSIIEDKNAQNSLIGGATEQKCPYCKSSYQDILILDGEDKRLSFLNIKGKIKVKTCLSCLPWAGVIMSSYELNGEGNVIIHEDGDEYYVDDEDLNRQKVMTLSKNTVPIHYGMDFDSSVIGGKPHFVDDAYFATCPTCGKRMKHLAELNSDSIDISGTVYIQICTPCKKVATLYQQT